MIYYPAGLAGAYDWAKAKLETIFSRRKSPQAEA